MSIGDTGMGRSATVIGFHEAVARLRDGAGMLAIERVPVAASAGRVLAVGVVSEVALPPFDNAAMDGVALASAGRSSPAASEWAIAARIGAGEPAPEDDGAAWEVMTGAALPAAADTVVPIERVAACASRGDDRARVRLLADARPGDNIRRRGEDVQPGQRVLAHGVAIDASHVMLLAGLGIDAVEVARRPRVALLATGRELVAPGGPLPPAAIHDATSSYLAAAVSAAGATTVRTLRVADDAEAFHAALDTVLAEGVDLVLSTGAVSKGCYDFVPRALDAREAACLFHGVALRPGKPVLAARLREGAMFVGLPGNPLSTAVAFRFLVEPLLRAWLGMPVEAERRVPLATACSKRAGVHAVLHARLRCDDEGRLHAHVGDAQASFRLLPFSQSSAWVTLACGDEHIDAGTHVLVHARSHLHPLPWDMA